MPTSPNFAFLADHDPLLVRYATLAERAFAADPEACLLHLRRFAEALALESAALVGLPAGPRDELVQVLGRLNDRGVFTAEIRALFHGIRVAGNAVAHPNPGVTIGHREALHQLQMARHLGVWFYRAFKAPNFKPGAFVPPPDPSAAAEVLKSELAALRVALTEERERAAAANQTVASAEAARLAAEAVAQRAWTDLEAALDLATETEASLAQARAEFDVRLAATAAAAATAPSSTIAESVTAAHRAATALVLDEAATRKLIDAQLREAGWEADSTTLRHSRGTRPEAGKNRAIAEWPTASGPADYVLFCGLEPVATVEAKRRNVDVSGHLEQAGRYARDLAIAHAGGPWGAFKVPFSFSTNGRPFLEQYRTKSGIWHRDHRRPQNAAAPLPAWYTPAGLLEELKKDIDDATARLAVEPTDYLGLRAYQIEAIKAVEAAIAKGDREILVAMATGTGKTRTTIGLVYRLIKTRRFRRVLFLVDRTSLGEQAAEAFREARPESNTSFADIFAIAGLDRLAPDETDKVHITTVQGMVRRILYSDAPPTVDTYDCVVVDESHRGYVLDRELSETELSFRDHGDYVSKYRRVLSWFDAVRIGLTATPALHTVEIFGAPVYTYSYRDAVLDGFLVDHEPPLRIHTRLSATGIVFEKGEEVTTVEKESAQVQLFKTPDEVKFEVEVFNRAVVTRPFNEVIAAELVRHIDPYGEAKTLVFCVDNDHADVFVDALREALRATDPMLPDELVAKITGSVDKPELAIRRFRNEPNPRIAVTVDLLTTGIDIPRIDTLLFLRRVNSRILYEQMKGRATRLCPEIGKTCFRILDAVGLTAALEDVDTMKPVVQDPRISFTQLAAELMALHDPAARQLVLDQLIAKLHARKRSLRGAAREEVEAQLGLPFEVWVEQVRGLSPEQVADELATHPVLPALLDRPNDKQGTWVYVSDHPDAHAETVPEFPIGDTADDYLSAFGRFLSEHGNDLPALSLILTRPRELTRGQLRALRAALDQAGFAEKALEAAWQKKTNQELAASIIGFVRQQALGSPLVPYAERVDRAVTRLLSSPTWSAGQRNWLKRIGAQIASQAVLDQEAIDDSEVFRTHGGFEGVNRAFGGRLLDVLGQLQEAIWEEAG